MKKFNLKSAAFWFGLSTIFFTAIFTCLFTLIMLSSLGYISNTSPERYSGLFGAKNGDPQRGYEVISEDEMFTGIAFDWENGIIVKSDIYTDARYFTIHHKDDKSKDEYHIYIYVPSIQTGYVSINGEKHAVEDNICKYECKLANQRTAVTIIDIS